jgi:hypothetical protein
MGDVADIWETNAVSIFNVEVSKVIGFLCLHNSALKSKGEGAIGASSGPVETVNSPR